MAPTSEGQADVSASSNSCNGGDQKQQHGGSARVGYFRKLMLCAQLWGMEASTDFEQLYTVPLLQTLGMPLRLVSLTGLVAGAMAMTMLPLIGWLTDRGSNPLHRKTIAIFFGAGLQVTGMACVVAANAMHVTYMISFNDNVNLTAEELQEVAGHGTIPFSNSSTVSTPVSTESAQRAMLNASAGAVYDGIFSNASGNVDHNEDVPEDPSEVPFKAGLGMFGFIVLSLGFDTMNSVVRSFVLACSPRAEHTSVLVLGLIMASAGGLSTASLGIVDFTQLFGLSSAFEGGSLVIQTSLQGILICIFVVLGLLVTTVSGRKQREVTLQHRVWPDIRDAAAASPSRPHHHRDELTESSRIDVFESSVRSFSGTGVNFDPTLSVLTQSPDGVSRHKRRRASSAGSDQMPLLAKEDDNALKDSRDFGLSYSNSLSRCYGSQNSAHLHSEQQQQQTVASAPSLEALPENALLKMERSRAATSDHCYNIGFKAKIGFLCLSTYFATAALLMFTMTSSDFVGKAVYGGDPEAPPGSESIARYQAGLRTASWGYIVYYATYLAVSFVHPRLLAKLGCRVEFVGVHVVLAMSMLLLSLTVRLEAFFFLCFMAGCHRACFYVVPYTATNDLVNAAMSSEGSKGNTAFTISLVTASMPLAYCSIFPWVGPLEEIVGSVIIPMWLGTIFSLVSAFFMILVGKIQAV